MSLQQQPRKPVAQPPTTTLSEDTVFEAMKTERRRETVRYLSNNPSETHETGDIADAVAEEQDVSRQTCYISLIQTHLPMLHDEGVIDYDDQSQTVEVTDEFEAVAWLVNKGREMTHRE